MANEQQLRSARHTPGPWEWDKHGYSLRPVEPDPDVSNLHTIIDREYGAWGFLGKDLDAVLAEDAANRRLIASAPELLDALQIAEEFMSGFEGDELQPGIGLQLHIIRAAIAKATGSAQ